MTVHFIGAGPGDPDLLTIRGRDLIARCPVCLYAGSLVPVAVVAHAPAGATVVDTASLTLDEIVALIVEAHAAGRDVARVHSKSEEHTSELQSLMRISYAVFCLKKNNNIKTNKTIN